jgi:uncharacterized protein YqjF (DUF2071 family)
MTQPFLTAEWRSLVMLNYAIDQARLAPFVPASAELDLWDGKALVSMVGFMFLKTRLLGIPVPFHRNFPEVNLRFYVRRKVGNEWRRGVTFIRELVPRAAIAWTARLIYNEPYLAVPMSHRRDPGELEYSWRFRGEWQRLGASIRGEPAEMPAGSEEEFIFEHYWGYTRQRDGGTVEYEVQHPRWRVWKAERSWLECDARVLYGEDFVAPLSVAPQSAFVADGSPIAVQRARRVSAVV